MSKKFANHIFAAKKPLEVYDFQLKLKKIQQIKIKIIYKAPKKPKIDTKNQKGKQKIIYINRKNEHFDMI